MYLALARTTERHGPIGVLEADAMDLSVIAALMGVGESEKAQREAWDAYAAPIPVTPMVKKPRRE